LKSILADVTGEAIRWDKAIPEVQKDLIPWCEQNKDKIVWDEANWKYTYK
jgi:hypothetical protein